jgi:hypothetical protein
LVYVRKPAIRHDESPHSEALGYVEMRVLLDPLLDFHDESPHSEALGYVEMRVLLDPLLDFRTG